MIARTIILLTLALAMRPAQAEDPWPTLELRASGYLTDFNSELRIDNSAEGRGTDNDLEDELDMDDALEELRLELRWRFLPRHSLDFSYYDISRDGHRVIDRELQIGDTTYVVGTDLDSSLDFEVYKLAYAYSFVHSDTTDTSFSLGIHAIDIGFQAKGTLLGLPVNRETTSAVLPLPVIGFQYSRRLGGPFSFSFEVDAFALEYEDYRGSLWDANATLDIAFTNHFGGFIGYNFVDMSIESDDADFPGEIDYQYGAVLAGIKLAF